MAEDFDAIAKEVANDLRQGDSKAASARLQEEFNRLDSQGNPMIAQSKEHQLFVAMDKELSNLGFPSLGVDSSSGKTMAAAGDLKVDLSGSLYEGFKNGGHVQEELSDAAHQAGVQERAVAKTPATDAPAAPQPKEQPAPRFSQAGATALDTSGTEQPVPRFAQVEAAALNTSVTAQPEHTGQHMDTKTIASGVQQTGDHTFAIGTSQQHQGDHTQLVSGVSDNSYPYPARAQQDVSEREPVWQGTGYVNLGRETIPISVNIAESELAAHGNRVRSIVREGSGHLTETSGLVYKLPNGKAVYQIDECVINGQIQRPPSRWSIPLHD